MAFPLGNARGVLGTTPVVGAGNLHIQSLAIQVEFITAAAAGFIQLFVVVEGSVTGTTIYSFVYDYLAAAAGTTYFNQPISLPGLNCVLPQGDGVQIRLINAAGVAAAVVGVNVWGSRL